MTEQPKWKCVAQLGDVNPIEYGGHWVLIDETGVYDPESEYLPESIDGETWDVYRYSLDKLKMVNGSLVTERYDESWSHSVKSYDEWFHKDIDSMASFVGVSSNELIEMFCSDDVIERARAYETIGMYHGFENLDHDPLTGMTKFEIVNRYRQNKYKEV